MVAVVGRVDDVRVVQLAQIFQLLVNLLINKGAIVVKKNKRVRISLAEGKLTPC